MASDINTEDMEANMATLVLSTDEDEVLKVDVNYEKIIKESYDLCLVGRLLTDQKV